MTPHDPTGEGTGGSQAQPLVSQFVSIDPDGTVCVRGGKVEIGQGILTATAQVAADNLGVNPDQVRVLPSTTSDGPDVGGTWGSMSIVHLQRSLGAACLQARDACVRAIAREWGVNPARVTVSGGEFRAEGHAATYGDLAAVIDLDVPLDPTDGAASPQAGNGRPSTAADRIDLPDKVAGRPRFIHDLHLPGQLSGRVLRPPSPHARLVGVDPARVEQLGQVVLVRDGSFVGVVGPDEHLVNQAVELLRTDTTWEETDSLPDETALSAYLRRGPHETTKLLDDPPSEGEGQRVSATYSRPFLAHASMAPSCGAARWNDQGSLSVWTHSQGVHRLRDAIAHVLDLVPDRVAVEHVEGAGCYGHNGADDAALDAVLLARAVPGQPVMVRWSRQDELSWAPFGSAMTADLTARVDEDGQIAHWAYDVWSQGHLARPGYAGTPGLLAAEYLERPWASSAAIDPVLANGGGTLLNAVPIYALPVRQVTGHRLLEPQVRSSALRALGAFLNVFAIESFMDELAAMTGTDPLKFRLRHLRDRRGERVLMRAATAAGWGAPSVDGVGQGLGFARFKDSHAYCAVVAEVEAEHEIRVRRLTIAVDAGRVINHDGLRNQIEGGALQATSWTLKERVRFDRRRVTSDTWETYPILRFSEAPDVSVEIVEDRASPSVGVGEAAQGPTAAAVGNAIANAVGVRVRDLPITTEAVVAAIETSHK